MREARRGKSKQGRRVEEEMREARKYLCQQQCTNTVNGTFTENIGRFPGFFEITLRIPIIIRKSLSIFEFSITQMRGDILYLLIQACICVFLLPVMKELLSAHPIFTASAIGRNEE